MRNLPVLVATAILLGAVARGERQPSRTAGPHSATVAGSRKAPRYAGPNRAWRLAIVRGDNLWIANGDGSRQRMLIRNASQPAWSPNRKRIAFARGHDVWIASVDGSHQRRLTHLPRLTAHERSLPDVRDVPQLPSQVYYDRGIEGISWGPRPNRVTYSTLEFYDVLRVRNGYRDRILGAAIYDLPVGGGRSSKPHVLFDLFDDRANCAFTFHTAPAWTLRGDALAFARNGDVWLADIHRDPGYVALSGQLPMDTTRIAATAEYDAPNYRGSRENYHVVDLSWSPDGNWLAYGTSRVSGSGFQVVHMLRLRRGPGHVSAQDRTLEGNAHSPCISPDGRLVAYCHEGALWCCTLAGREKRKLLDDGDRPVW